MTFILSRLVEPKFLEDPSFIYREAHLEKKGMKENLKNPNTGKDRVYNFYQDSLTKECWFADEPHHVRALLRIFFIATAVVFAATCALRAVQVALILPGVFFLTFKASFSEREKEEFSEILFDTFEAKIKEQGEAFCSIGTKFVIDVQCGLAMETAALVGGFSQEMNKVIQMQVIFSEMERRWNGKKDPEKSLVSLWAKALNKGTLFALSSEEMNRLREESNRSFYIYQCAQPVNADFYARIKFIEGSYNSYQEIVDKYVHQSERL